MAKGASPGHPQATAQCSPAALGVPSSCSSAAIAGAHKQPCFISRGNSSKPPQHFDFGKVFIPVKIRKAPLAWCEGPQEGLQPTCLGARQPRAERLSRQMAPWAAAASVTAGLAQDRPGPAATGLARLGDGVTWKEAG